MEPVVQTARGRVRGTTEDGVAVFKGIPYAAPPFGAQRQQPPVPPAPWDGVRDALTYGPTAPHGGYPAPFDRLLPEPIIPGEDCLNLNVWTPDPAGAGLPVLVWIHGGAFVNGSGAVPQYDGRRFARDGVVAVTINYRLGAEGFLYLAEAGGTANLGLLDQLAALAWVQENIAAFGGDPGNVTVAGESAGGMSVTTLLSMPRSKGLFRRVIAQSGAGHHSLSPATADKVGRALCAKLGVEPTRTAIAAVPADRVLAAQRELSLEVQLAPDPEAWGEVRKNIMLFEPVVDGDVLPARPIDGIAAGTGAGPDVDVLIGSNLEEQRFFLLPNGVLDMVDDTIVDLGAAGYDLPPDAIAQYRKNRPGATPGDVLAAISTDWFFRIPAIRVAEARPSARTWLYEFTWRSPLFEGRLGACHALEIPFVFDTLDTDGADWMTGPNPPPELAESMHGAWVQFVQKGDPGWPRYDLSDRATMRFDTASEVIDNPRAGERQLWDGVR